MRCRWVFWLGLVLVLWAGAAVPARAQGPTGPVRVGLVVKHNDGRVITSCVSLTKANPTGLDVLRASGLNANIDYSSGIGAAICALDGQGCISPGQQCFCQCQGANCVYWNYSYLTNANGGNPAQWTPSLLGAFGRQVAPGDVEGWSWGSKFPTEDGSAGPYSFAQVCAAPAAAPAPTLPPPPPATVIPTTTEKSVPLQTPAPPPMLPSPTATSISTATEKSVRLLPSPAGPTLTTTFLSPVADLTATSTGLASATVTSLPLATEKDGRLLPSPAGPAPTNIPASLAKPAVAPSVVVTLSPSPMQAPSQGSVPAQNKEGNTNSLVGYGIFALLLLSLGGILLWAQRR